jgi:hypothetical protein
MLLQHEQDAADEQNGDSGEQNGCGYATLKRLVMPRMMSKPGVSKMAGRPIHVKRRGLGRPRTISARVFGWVRHKGSTKSKAPNGRLADESFSNNMPQLSYRLYS